jgi:hypothetical protein
MLANPETDSIGQQCAVMKVDGDNTASDMYFAIRTTGPYASTDGALIRAGTDSVFTVQLSNISRVYSLVTSVAAGTQFYWGAVLETGDAVMGSFLTKDAPGAETGGVSPGGRILA